MVTANPARIVELTGGPYNSYMSADHQLALLLLTVFGSGFGIGCGYWRRWATIHLRQRLEDQANAIHTEYTKDREYMGECLRAAGVLPFEKVEGVTATAPDARFCGKNRPAP